MERRKLGWIKIVKKDREFLIVVEENSSKWGASLLHRSSKASRRLSMWQVMYNFVTVYAGIYRAI